MVLISIRAVFLARPDSRTLLAVFFTFKPRSAHAQVFTAELRPECTGPTSGDQLAASADRPSALLPKVVQTKRSNCVTLKASDA